MNHFNERLAQRVLDLLKKGQAHKRGMCEALEILTYVTLDATVTKLVREGRVVILGTAQDAGYTDTRINAPVYGLPGMKLVRVAPDPRAEHKTKGSGVIAGRPTIRGYRYGWGWRA